MAKSNFHFLQNEWGFLYQPAVEAEQNAKTAPVTSAFYARLSLEKMVNWLYENCTSSKQSELFWIKNKRHFLLIQG